MAKQFITVDLTPGFKENKNTSRTIYVIVGLLLVVTLMFRFFYVPLLNVNNEITKHEVLKTKYTAQSNFLWLIRNGQAPNERDILIDDTLEYIDSTQINLSTRLSSITSIDIDGVELEILDYNHSANLMNLKIYVEHDEALLTYIERLWSVYWIDRVEYTRAGPGAIDIVVHFTVGEMVSDEE